jgi:hypothetical protein
MGLMDRDDMHDKDRPRPFSPPPERMGTLGKVLIFLLVLALLYLAADWKLNQPARDIAKQRATDAVQTQRPATTSHSQQAPPVAATPNAGGNAQTVTKCVVNGRTSYTDDSCNPAAKTSQLVIKENHNLVAAVRVPLSIPEEQPAPQYSAFAQASPDNDDYAEMKAECKALDERIKYLDALARQPQSGSMQDWIRGERKSTRDRQARIPCR